MTQFEVYAEMFHNHKSEKVLERAEAQKMREKKLKAYRASDFGYKINLTLLLDKKLSRSEVAQKFNDRLNPEKFDKSRLPKMENLERKSRHKPKY